MIKGFKRSVRILAASHHQATSIDAVNWVSDLAMMINDNQLFQGILSNQLFLFLFLDEVDEIWHRPGQAVVEEVEVEVALALGVAVKLVLKTLDEKVGLTLDVGRGQFRLVEAVPNEELLHRLVVEG